MPAIISGSQRTKNNMTAMMVQIVKVSMESRPIDRVGIIHRIRVAHQPIMSANDSDSIRNPFISSDNFSPKKKKGYSLLAVASTISGADSNSSFFIMSTSCNGRLKPLAMRHQPCFSPLGNN